MSTPDDLSPLKVKPFKDAIDKFEELMTQSGRAFLLGAGCSKCAGLPLTDQLTQAVISNSKLGKVSAEILKLIQTNFNGATSPNIEDYLSELVDLLAIADRRALSNAQNQGILIGKKTYTDVELRNATKEIKMAISEEIDKKVTIETHWNFVKAVHRPVRPGMVNGSQRVDYLILNYDTLIEDALGLEKVPYTDGLDGGSTGWWSPNLFMDNNLSARVLKLHGSINWTQFPGDNLPRRVPKTIQGSALDDQRIVIWPASTKYRETQLDPYAQLTTIARDILRPKNNSPRLLCICGYKFGDSHINLELDHALKECRDLTIVIFWSEDKLEGILKKWNDDVNVRDQVLIYGKKGFWYGDTYNASKKDLPWWKFENVTRLLGGER